MIKATTLTRKFKKNLLIPVLLLILFFLPWQAKAANCTTNGQPTSSCQSQQPGGATDNTGGAASAACQGLTGIDSNANCTNTSTSGKTIGSLLNTVINIMSIVIGAVAIIMIIVGAFKFLTAAGDSNNVASARNTIIYALVGLVIAALAQILVHFVLTNINK